MRRTLGLSILWAFAGNLCAAAKIPVKPHFKYTGLLGTWYPIALVRNDGSQKHIWVTERVISSRSRHDLTFEFTFVGEHECDVEMVEFRHTRTPGQFTTESYDPEFDGYKVSFVDTDYKKYNIFHIEKEGKKILLLDANSRSVSPEIRRRFKKWALSLGFPSRKIIDMPQLEFCYRDKTLL